MSYDHTQTGSLSKMLNWLGVFVIAGAVFFCWKFPAEPPSMNLLVFVLVCGVGVLIFAVARMFGWLRVRDDRDALDVRFGPGDSLGKRIPYTQMTEVEAAESNILDGWGIHWIPGRGWIYNISGHDCVRITIGDRVIRVGTDDQENLLAFLKTKVPSEDD